MQERRHGQNMTKTLRYLLSSYTFRPVATAGICLLAAAEVVAQRPDSVRVAGPPACAECRIELHPVLELGDDEGEGRLERTLASWARDSRGRIYLSGGSFGRVRVFDSSGRFLRTLAERDEGAEDPPSIGLVAVAPGDTVHLVDDLAAERRVLDPELREVRRAPTSVHLQASSLMLLLPGGELLASGVVPTREGIGFPLHRVGADGEAWLSFGSENPRHHPGGETMLRKLARSGASELWAGFLHRYRLERWTLEGEHRLTVVREAPWFEPYTRVTPVPGEPPRPILMAMREDAEGRLWTLVRVADPEWERAEVLPADTAVLRRNPMAAHDLAEVYDTMVEVFDGRCGTLLHSQRFPGLLVGFLDDSHILEWRVRGVVAPPRLGVWRVEPNFPPRSEQPCRSVP
jgi:hypothetical protein